MKVGGLLQAMSSVDMCRAVIEGLEGVGVDDIWLPDHLMGLAHPELWPELPASEALDDPDSWLDPFCVVAALGQHTNLRMGTCVTDSARRRGADLARTAYTLSQACRGGFVLGIGAGEAESILPFGYGFDRPLGSFERALMEIRSIFDTGNMPDGCGRSGLRTDGGPTPEVWVAAHGPRSLTLTGRYGDGWLPTTPTAELYAQQWEQVKDAAAAAERSAPTAGLCALTIFGPSRDDIFDRIAKTPMSKMLMLFQPAEVWRRYGLEHPAGPDTRGWIDTIPHAMDADVIRSAVASVPDEMLDERVLIGNADDVAERLAPFAAAGAEHVVVCDITAMVYRPIEAAAQADELRKLCESQRPADEVSDSSDVRRTP